MMREIREKVVPLQSNFNRKCSFGYSYG